MYQSEYRIVLTGTVIDGFSLNAATAALARLFKIDNKKAVKLLGGNELPIKKAMARAKAENYCKQLQARGIGCRCEPLTSPPEPTVKQHAATANAEHSALSLGDRYISQTQEETATESSHASITPEKGEALLPPHSGSAISALTLVPITTAEEKVAPLKERISTQLEPQSVDAVPQMVCPKCRAVQERTDTCRECGIIISKYIAAQEQKFDTPAQDKGEEEDPLRDMRNYVGDNFNDYHSKFQDLERNEGRYKLQWHWPGFLIPVPWLIYRKLYLTAGLLLLISLFSPLTSGLIISVVLGLTANYIYYRKAKYVIAKNASRGDARHSELYAKGGVNSIAMTIVIFLGVSIIFGFFALQMVISDPDFKEAMTIGESFASSMEAANEDPDLFALNMWQQTLFLRLKVGEMQGNRPSMPSDMDELAALLEISQDELVDHNGNKIAFSSVGDEVEFRSAGADEILYSEDDLISNGRYQ